MAKDDDTAPQVKRRKIASTTVTDFAKDIAPTRLPDSSDEAKSTSQLVQQIESGKEFIQSVLTEIADGVLSETLERDLRNIVSSGTDVVCKLATFGASGAGKSTLLNALLGKQGVLPSGSMGEACTPVPIEIWYNDDEAQPFRAEIEYITEEQWSEDIDSAKSALEEGGAPEGQSQNPIDKIQVAYPKLKLSDIRNMTTNEVIMSNDVIKNLLGKTETFSDVDRKTFEKSLRPKLVAKTASLTSTHVVTATWPIVQSVRLFVRNPLLARGLVFVDIPGILDSNSVRASRIKEYIQKCSAVCVVAPSIRAGSDSTFQGMLGDALGQVQYGGRLDRIILISTKSDDFDPEEVQADLNEETPELRGLLEEKHVAEQERSYVQEQLDDHETSLKGHFATVKLCDRDISTYQYKKKRLINGVEVYRPGAIVDGKRLKDDTSGDPLSQDSIDAAIKNLQSQRSKVSAEAKRFGKKAQDENFLIKQYDAKIEQLEHEFNRHLLMLRNDILKANLSDMYARKVREHDQQAIQAEREMIGEEGHDLLRDINSTEDDDHLRVSLPVFCVSAVRYLQLAGYKKPDTRTGLFATEEDTDIPALSEHLETIVSRTRHGLVREIHDRLTMALNSLDIFLLSDVDIREVDVAQSEVAVKTTVTMLAGVRPTFEQCVTDAFGILEQKYQATFVKLLPTVKKFSIGNVLRNMALWTSNPAGGVGMYFPEYKAAVSRNGVWDAGRRPGVDMNSRIATKTRASFTKCVNRLFGSEKQSISDQALNICLTGILTSSEQLHKDFRTQANAAGVSAYALARLEEQHVFWKQRMVDIVNASKSAAESLHGDASTALSSDIQAVMRPAYSSAKKASGPGALTTMASYLSQAIEEDVLSGPLDALEHRLGDNIKRLFEGLDVQLNELSTSMVTDYKQALEKRDQKACIVKDPTLNKIRHRMVGLGYASAQAVVVEKEEPV